METTNDQRRLTCESCGTQFDCCPGSRSGCWCAAVALSDAALQELKAKYAECLCPECLGAYAMSAEARKEFPGG